MEIIFLILLVGFTSTFAHQCTRRLRPLSAGSLTAAVGEFFEWIGTFALFFAANLALGVVIISLIRGFTPRFVTLYVLENLLLLILSAAQAFVFQHWWKHD
jgi:hypothetical protein